MDKLVAKIDFSIDGVHYIVGDKIDTKDIKLIKKLNEKGFIEPLSHRDLVLIERELNKNKNEL